MEKSYYSLVERRKNCTMCSGYGMANSAFWPQLDCNEIGLWSKWQANLRAEVMVVGQDWGTQNFFLKSGGAPEDNNPTNRNLTLLLKQLGISIDPPSAVKGRGDVFFTNGVLCLKQGNDSTKIQQGCLKNCSENFLGPLMEIVKPRIVIALGRIAYIGCLMADGKSAKITEGFMTLVDKHHHDELSYGGKLFPVVHCSPVACNLARSLDEQIKDWKFIASFMEGNHMGKIINHLNYFDNRSRAYCKRLNKIVSFPKHWDECHTCDLFRGSNQGDGVECEWFDEDCEACEFVRPVHSPEEEYKRLNSSATKVSKQGDLIVDDYLRNYRVKGYDTVYHFKDSGTFEGDKHFLKWIANNPTGYVINCIGNSCIKVHSAKCWTLKAKDNWTIAPNSKVCSVNKSELKRYAQDTLTGSEITCKVCNPTL